MTLKLIRAYVVKSNINCKARNKIFKAPFDTAQQPTSFMLNGDFQEKVAEGSVVEKLI